MRRFVLLFFAYLLLGVGLKAQRDVTKQYIVNATLSEGTKGWTVSNFNNPQQGNNTKGWASESYAGWGNLDVKSYSLTQKITLPKGHYRLANYSFFRQGLNADTDKSKSLAYLVAGSQKVAIQTLGSIATSGYANSQADGANCFDSKMYRNVVEFAIDADNTQIEVGLTGTFDLKQSWVIAGMFELFDLNQIPNEETPTDMTYAIKNSGFEYRDLTGWVLSANGAMKVQNNTSFTDKSGAYYCEQWQQNGGLSDRSVSQTLKDLPAGYYTLSAYCKYDGTGAILFANDAETSIVAGQSGQYTVKKKITKGQDLNIGLKLVNGTSNWVCVDRFSLTYYPVDLTSLKEKYQSLLAEANALFVEPMDFPARATLQNAIDKVVLEDEDSYISANEELESAIATARESVETCRVTHATNENPADLTDKIKNAGYEEGEAGWSKTQNQTGSGSYGVVKEDAGNVFSSTYNTYMHHETVYQEGIKLKPGTYRLSARLKGTPKDDSSTFIYATDGAVNHWDNPVFKGNAWYGYLKRISEGEWTTATVCFTLTEETTIRIGVLSWGNNVAGGTGGAFAVDDWKLEAVAYSETKHAVGDANGDGKATSRDMAVLVNALNSGTVDALYEGADANGDGRVDASDVKAMEDAILAKDVQMSAGSPSYGLTVYAKQLMSENMDGTRYMLQHTTNIAPASVTDLEKWLTKVTVKVNGISGVSGVSIFAKGKEAIAGTMECKENAGSSTITDGLISNGYARSMKSDVVTVQPFGSSNVVTAYLLPVQLSKGVTVTVESNGTYYSQDFTDLDMTAGKTIELEFTNKTPNGAWLATIPGDIHFNYLTLPCAHDAATSGVTSLGKCQSLTIEKLLQSGVKGLDLRPNGKSGVTADNMTIYHGVLNTNIKFKDALATVKKYLTDNPSETIFILVHDENGNASDAWKSAVLTCVEQVQDYVKVIDGNMLLDDCRGKMVIVARDNVGNTNLLGKCGWGSSFNDKTLFYGSDGNGTTPWTLLYQDNYENGDIDSRLADAEKLLSDYIMKNEYDQNRIYFNSLNIASGLSAPASFAEDMNNAFVNSTVVETWEGRMGIVSADFLSDVNYGGDSLVKALVWKNYQYVFRGRTR